MNRTISSALRGSVVEEEVALTTIELGRASRTTEQQIEVWVAEGVLQPSGEMKAEPRMDAEHVGSAVAYMASLPLDANVLFMTVMATKMPFVGRG